MDNSLNENIVTSDFDHDGGNKGLRVCFYVYLARLFGGAIMSQVIRYVK